jgi:alkyl sulfatase BDS1-like metallo-beta-lactamase superfamily hydrolase
MVADLLDLSARIIDSGRADEPVNRITQELSEVADGLAVIESFSHCVLLTTPDGLVAFDSSSPITGSRVVRSLRGWSQLPVRTLIYTHGHLDHVGGSPAFIADSQASRSGRPIVVGHEAVLRRFERYRRTDGWNRIINERQFGWLRNTDLRIASDSDPMPDRFLPEDVAEPDITYTDSHLLTVGGVEIQLYHGLGETDDHTWAWIPSQKTICCGDYLIWNFPNAGNPQKVQRYPAEWATALRAMADLEPNLLIPAHGLPIGGAERIRTVLLDVAEVLEDLVERCVALMNAGATLDDIIHTVRVSADTLARPYLRPLYDEPEFVIRNIWRLYGGWWDANPARLKPPADARLAAEVAGLAGGIERLIARARDLAGSGDLALACQMAEWAVQAAPAGRAAHELRADVYRRRHQAEASLMAKGIFAGAATESERRLAALPETNQS